MPAASSSTKPGQQGFNYASLDAGTSEFVQQQTGQIRLLMKRTVESIIEIGQRLTAVKERLSHGRFGAWLQAEFDWDERTAQRFMNVVAKFGHSYDNLSELNFAPSALYLLAAPSTPKAARSEALARAKAGEAITYTTAKGIKQKYATPPTKLKSGSKPEPKPEPEAVSQSPPTPTSVPPLQSAVSQLRSVAICPQGKAPARPPETVREYSPKQSSSWWQLGGRHLLYCGDPHSPAFRSRITEEVQLLLAFPPTTDWQTPIPAKTRIIATEYLPQGKNLDRLDEVLEVLLMFYTRLGDLVVSCFLPEPEILSIVNRLERRGVYAEPDPKRVNQIISDWKRVGLKAERVS